MAFAPGFNVNRSQPGWSEQDLTYSGYTGLGTDYLGNQYGSLLSPAGTGDVGSNLQQIAATVPGMQTPIANAAQEAQRVITQPTAQAPVQGISGIQNVGFQAPVQNTPSQTLNPIGMGQQAVQQTRTQAPVYNQNTGQMAQNRLGNLFQSGNLRGMYDFAQDKGMSNAMVDQAMMAGGYAPNWQSGNTAAWIGQQGLGPLRNTTYNR